MKKLLLIIALATSFSSCEKVIEIELNNANPKVVIEAELEEGTHDFSVKVSRTGDYFGNDTPDAITNATISLTDDAGNSTAVPHVIEGLYRVQGFAANTETTYTLSVAVEGETYTSSAYIPEPVQLDSLVAREPFFGPPDGEFEERIIFTFISDPADTPNYYRMNAFRNGAFDFSARSIVVFDDKFSDGQQIEIPYFNNFFNPGDTVVVELLSIDEGVYDFYLTLNEVIGSNGGPAEAAPANPNTNIKGGAIGYFGASSKATATIVVPE